MKHALLGLLIGTSLAQGATETPAVLGPKPFLASYAVSWRGMNAGTSEFELKRQPDGRYVYTSRSNASGLLRIVVSDEILQTSTFMLTAEGIKPLQYRGDDGSPKTDRDVSLDFDWQNARVTGTAENQAVDLPLAPQTQDAMSVQIAAIHELQQGHKLTDYKMVDKNQVKEYHYTYEGTARIKTVLGELDTVVYRSQRAGSNKRITRTWQAPSLGFIPVRAERLKDGKREMLLEIQKLEHH